MLVAVTILAACSPDRPDSGGRTVVPSDMPGARNSASITSANGAIRIVYPLPGTVVTNTVTIQGTSQVAGAEYHVGVEARGLYLAEETLAAEDIGPSGAFSVTLSFDPVTQPVDGEVIVYTTEAEGGSVDQQAIVPVKLAPAGTRTFGGPVIHLSPDNGKPGTPVVVIGEGFPSNSIVEIRLSGVSTEATEQAYASGRTDSYGAFKLSFTMPAFWPSGDPILAPEVLIVASTPDFVTKATAVFAFGSSAAPQSGTPLPGAEPAVRMAEAFLRAWSDGSPTEALNYLSLDYRTRVSSGGSATTGIARLLGMKGVPGRSSVAVVAASLDETVVRATIQTEGGPLRADITLEEAPGGWQIVWIAPALSDVR